jgi:cytochrome c oxidase subunit 3
VIEREDHFATLEQQAQAVKLGLAAFLASEALLFTGILALITAYRADWPAAFTEGVHHNTKILGSINTGVLLTSSALVAIAVELRRATKTRAAAFLTLATAGLGVIFVIIKLTEYAHHFRDGIYPGARGMFFQTHHVPGLPTFWTLYYLATGLHAIHVTCGVGVLSYRGIRDLVAPTHEHTLEATALYWHLVDVIWIFLWPLFYLA